MARKRTSAAVDQIDTAPATDALGVVVRPIGGTGGSTTIAGPLGRAADAASVSVALSTEDVAILTGPTPAGTNAIGKLTANSGVTIGAVELAAAQTLATVTTVAAVTTLNAVIPGVGATNLGKAEDAAHTTGDTGVAVWAVRNDTPTALAGTTVDYIPFTTNAFGGLWSSLVDNSGTPVSFAGITSIARLLSAAASTNGTNVKASAGFVYHIIGRNAAAATRYLKLYNTAGTPTVGTDVPVATIEIPASTVFDFTFEQGIYFSTGIGYGWTTAQADNSTAALTAGDIVSQNIFYT